MSPIVPNHNPVPTGEGTGPPPALLVTIREATRLLSLSRAEIYRLIQRGELRVVHVGRAVRISHSALVAYVAELESRARVDTHYSLPRGGIK